MSLDLANRRPRFFTVLLGVVLAAAGCQREGSAPSRTGHEPPPSTPVVATPEWTPDPAMAKELGKPMVIGDFTIAPPKGYVLVTKEEGVPGGNAASWEAPAGPPPVGPRVLAMIIVPGKDGEPDPPASSLRTRPRKTTGLTEYKESEPETGLIAGRLFERVTTTTAAAQSGRKVRGFQYVSPGKPSVVILYQGADEDDASFRAAEAAARTFRRK
jgi:hypothetical protein